MIENESSHGSEGVQKAKEKTTHVSDSESRYG